MGDYTLRNFKDLPDGAGERGLSPGLEIRMARSQIDSEHLGVSFFRFGPNFRSPLGHHHEVQEEAYVVTNGSGYMKLDDEVIELHQWDVVRVSPETIRAFEGGPDGLEIIAIGSDRPEEGDGKVVENFWP